MKQIVTFLLVLCACCAFAQASINILKDVKTTPDETTPGPDVCMLMRNANVIILLDCSSNFSARSRVYRKSCCGKCDSKKCKHRSIWVNDYVKIYLDNFNQYRYSAIIDDQQVDAAYAAAMDLFKKEDKSGAAPATENKDDAKEKLLKYAEATQQLKVFIDFVKNNTQPDSRLLEANKLAIAFKLTAEELTDPDEIETLYATADDENLKPIYEIARLFSARKTEFDDLSYTLEATILPIKIKSFDKLEFTITLTNTQTKTVLKPREYQFLIKGGLKVDQSFGVAVHDIHDQEFGLRSLIESLTTYAKYPNGDTIKVTLPNGNQKDSIANIMDVAKREIVEENSPTRIAISATTLTHLYARTCIGNRIAVGIGPEVGIAVDVFPKQAFRYLLGGGILLYDGRHRISLDGGLAFGKYNTFGNGQGFGTKLTGADAQPLLVERNGWSWYIGISYNAPLIRKETQKVE